MARHDLWDCGQGADVDAAGLAPGGRLRGAGHICSVWVVAHKSAVRASETMAPSSSRMRRSMRAARSRSCVTATTVLPCSRPPGSRRIWNTCSLDLESRRAGRLVGQDDGRIVGERAGHRHALALAAGELVGPLVSVLARARGRRAGARPLAHVVLAAGGPARCIGSITLSSAENSGSRKWNWNTKPSVDSRVAARSASSMCAVARPPMQHLTVGRQVEQAQQIEQRRLAGARRPGDGHELACRRWSGRCRARSVTGTTRAGCG